LTQLKKDKLQKKGRQPQKMEKSGKRPQKNEKWKTTPFVVVVEKLE
jgi:hypothetical protein